MSVSFHKYGDYFPGTGALNDIGLGPGKGYSVNVPLKDGLDDLTFEILVKDVLFFLICARVSVLLSYSA